MSQPGVWLWGAASLLAGCPGSARLWGRALKGLPPPRRLWGPRTPAWYASFRVKVPQCLSLDRSAPLQVGAGQRLSREAPFPPRPQDLRPCLWGAGVVCNGAWSKSGLVSAGPEPPQLSPLPKEAALLAVSRDIAHLPEGGWWDQ